MDTNASIVQMIRVPPSAFAGQLSTGAKALYDAQEFTDVNFRVESQSGIRELGAHRFILAIRSPVLAERLRSDGVWSMQTTVLSDVNDYQVMASLLEFVYTDQLLFPRAQALHLDLVFLSSLNVAAKTYGLPRLAALANKGNNIALKELNNCND